MNKKARSRKFTAKQSARLGVYLAAGVGAAIGSSTNTEAAIVLFDINPDANVPNGGMFRAGNIYLNPPFYMLGTTSGNWFRFDPNGAGMTWYGVVQNAQSYYGVEPLSFGATIDGSRTWGGTGSAYVGGGSPWVNGASTYVGLRMDAGGGDYNYGWVNLTFTVNNGAVVTGFAFEDQVNTAILAGDQGGPAAVPEPGTWAAAALLAGGATFLRWRRRRDEAQKEAA